MTDVPLPVAREVIEAACRGEHEIYRALERALRTTAEIEAVSVWEASADRFICVFTSGARYEHYLGAALSAFVPSSPLAEARRSGRHAEVRPPLAPLHPADRVALVIPLGDDVSLLVYLALAERVRGEELARLLGFCDLAAPVLRIARDRADDHARATFDGLTGLLTPRAFRTELAQHIRLAPRTRIAPRIALVFLDTDRFKEWNDRFGHAAGDDLLRKLAAMLRAHAEGPEDFVARNGGDEFCLVWSDCEKSNGIMRAEALRSAIAGAFAAEAIAITASIGVAAYPADAQTAEALLEVADAAMYASKRGGRNRVSYAPMSPRA